MPLDPMTPEQQRMVEDNLALAHYEARKYRAPLSMDYEDWLGECLVLLVQAVRYYEPQKGTLSTLMDRLVYLRRMDLKRQRQSIKRKTHYDAVSLDQMAGDNTLGEQVLVDHDRALHLVEVREVVDLVLARMSPQAVQIFRLLANDSTNREAARTLGICRSRVCDILMLARGIAAQQYPDEVVHNTSCPDCGVPQTTWAEDDRPRLCSPCADLRVREIKRRYHQRRKQEAKA